MLGIKTIKLNYYEIDNVMKEGEVFFFGNPGAHPTAVFSTPFSDDGMAYDASASTNQYNVDKIIELTDLKSILIKNCKVKDNLGTAVGAGHPLQRKINFIKDLIRETAVTYLISINRLLWEDLAIVETEKYDPNEGAEINADNRWRETGV